MRILAGSSDTRWPGTPPSAGAPLDRRHLAILGGLVAFGAGIRIWIVLMHGAASSYDLSVVSTVARALSSHPLHVYSTLHYLYPGGYLPIILLCRWISDLAGADLWNVFKIPSVVADLAIAVTLVWGLGRFGASQRERLMAAAVVALGPLFIVVSGFQGQIDAAAVLPALVAVILWQLGGERRGWQAGLLIGIGAAIKSVPMFMLLAMVPTARSRREVVTLLGCALGVYAASVAPFLIADWRNTTRALTGNQGQPGIGGLSLLVQPDLASHWIHRRVTSLTGATIFFGHQQNLIVGVSLLLAGAYAYRRRMNVVWAATLLWLVLYVTDMNWNYNNLIWGLPFFLLLRQSVAVLVFMLVLALPGAEMYFQFGITHFEGLYIPLLMLAWVAFAATAFAVVRLHVRDGKL